MSGDVRFGSDEEWLLNAYDGLPWCSQYWVSRRCVGSSTSTPSQDLSHHGREQQQGIGHHKHR